MKRNVGGLDRIVRIMIGIAIIAAGVYFKSWWGGIGLIPFLTGALSWCPLYIPLKISTGKTKIDK